MIVHKAWVSKYTKGIRRYHERWEGWFLLGFIPLYMVRHERTSELV